MAATEPRKGPIHPLSLAFLLALSFACATGVNEGGGGDDADAGFLGGGNGNGNGNGTADASASRPDAGSFGSSDAAAGAPDAAPGDETITVSHNDDTTTIATEAPDSGEPFVGCFGSADPFLHHPSAYQKVFDLSGEFGIDGDFVVESVELGVLLADAGGDSAQPATITLAHQSETSVPDPQNATVIERAEGTIPNISQGFLSLQDLDVTVPAGQALLVELFLEDGVDNNNSFLTGVNFAGESASTFLVAPECGLNQPFGEIADPDGNNLGNRNWVVRVQGSE